MRPDRSPKLRKLSARNRFASSSSSKTRAATLHVPRAYPEVASEGLPEDAPHQLLCVLVEQRRQQLARVAPRQDLAARPSPAYRANKGAARRTCRRARARHTRGETGYRLHAGTRSAPAAAARHHDALAHTASCFHTRPVGHARRRKRSSAKSCVRTLTGDTWRLLPSRRRQATHRAHPCGGICRSREVSGPT